MRYFLSGFYFVFIFLIFAFPSFSYANTQGYAWSESVGWFDFSNVVITDTNVTGYAYNDNTGWLSFEDGTNVTTTWAPAVAEVEEQPSRSGRTGSKKRILTKSPTTPIIVNTPNQLPQDSSKIKEMLSSNPRDLELNMEGEDVKMLQQFLNQQGFLLNTQGLVGSKGFETNYFGNLTKQALIKFQQANNIFPAAGYFGPITRSFIKTLIINN